jgi:hypothetical protein
MTSPFIPSSFIYGDSPSGAAIETIQVASRAPNSNDNQYSPGTLWLNAEPAGTGNLYFLAGFSSGVPQWELLGTASGNVDTLTDTAGTVVTPIAGNIQLTSANGNLTIVAGAHLLTFTLAGPYTPTTYTAHSVLLGEGTSSIGTAGPNATSGIPLIAQGVAADPIFGTAVVAGGGTGAVTLTGVLTGNGTSAVTANAVTQFGVVLGGASNAVGSTAVGATGTVLAGNTGANPTFQAIPSLNVVDVTGTSQAMAVNTTYIADNAGLVTFTLPATAAQGTTMTVVGNGAGGWTIAQNANQAIKMNAQTTTTGATGSLSSTNRYNSVTMLATVGGASTIWVIDSSSGTLTFV